MVFHAVVHYSRLPVTAIFWVRPLFTFTLSHVIASHLVSSLLSSPPLVPFSSLSSLHRLRGSATAVRGIDDWHIPTEIAYLILS